jgi:hypothetical protein
MSSLVQRWHNQADAPNPGIAPPFQVERQWRRVGDPDRSAAMRALLPFVSLLMVGCAAFFRGGATQVGLIPHQPPSSVVFRTVLRRDARAISFVSSASVMSENWVTVTLSNSSGRTISVQRSGAFADVPPHTTVELFTGSLSALLGGQRLPVSSWSGRAACELNIQFDSPPKLAAPIKVLCSYSSSPL